MEADFKVSEHAIKTRTKALIARGLYENEAFYVVINDLNPALKKAIEVLQDGTFDKSNLDHSSFRTKEIKNNKLINLNVKPAWIKTVSDKEASKRTNAVGIRPDTKLCFGSTWRQ